GPWLSALVEMIVDQFRNPRGNAVDFAQVLDRGAADRLGGAESQQQGAFAARTDAADLVERALDHLLLAARAVRTDGETVDLIAQALDKIKDRVAYRQRK